MQFCFGLCALFIFLPATHAVAAETRIALIIGNSDYTWHGSMVIAGINWNITEQNSANGVFEFKALTEDSGSCAYANNQWHTNSTVTGHSDAGTYRVIDAGDVEFTRQPG